MPDATLEVGWWHFDRADPKGLAGWWQELLVGEVREDDDGDVLLRGGSVGHLLLALPETKTVK